MNNRRHRIHPLVLQSLHDRRLTVDALALAVQSGRAHVTQVMANKPGRGHHTRRRLAPLLTELELYLQGWRADGALVERKLQ